MSAQATPAPAPTAEKKKLSRKQKSLRLALRGILLIIIALIIERSGIVGTIAPAIIKDTARNRLRTRAAAEHESRAENVDNTQNLTEAIRKNEDNNVQYDHDLDQIQNGVHNCPETDGWQNGRKDLVLTECGNGTTIWIQMPNSFKETKFKASLYKKGEGGQLVQLAIKPVIEVVDPKDKFSQAVEISPAGSISPVDYKVRGDIKFTTLGADADVLVLELIP